MMHKPLLVGLLLGLLVTNSGYAMSNAAAKHCPNPNLGKEGFVEINASQSTTNQAERFISTVNQMNTNNDVSDELLCSSVTTHLYQREGQCMGEFEGMKYLSMRAGVSGYCADAIANKSQATSKMKAFLDSEYSNIECTDAYGDPLGGVLENMVVTKMEGLAFNMTGVYSDIDFTAYKSPTDGKNILEFIAQEKEYAQEDGDTVYMQSLVCFEKMFTKGLDRNDPGVYCKNL